MAVIGTICFYHEDTKGTKNHEDGRMNAKGPMRGAKERLMGPHYDRDGGVS